MPNGDHGTAIALQESAFRLGMLSREVLDRCYNEAFPSFRGRRQVRTPLSTVLVRLQRFQSICNKPSWSTGTLGQLHAISENEEHAEASFLPMRREFTRWSASSAQAHQKEHKRSWSTFAAK